MIIRGVKKEDCIVRGASNSPKQCRVHAKSLIELQKHLKEINYIAQPEPDQPKISDSQNEIPDIKKITRQISAQFFNSKKRSSSSTRLKTDDGRMNTQNSQNSLANPQNAKFIPFINERDQLGRLLTENNEVDDDVSVFTYRPNTQRKHAKSIDALRIKNMPSKTSINNDYNKNAIIQLRMNGLLKERKAEEQISKNKIEEMIETYAMDNKILLGVNKQNQYEVQQSDHLNYPQVVSYRLNIKHQEDLQKNQVIANSLTFARGFYKRAQADEQYKRIKTTLSSHRAETLPTEETHTENNENPDNKFKKNKTFFLNMRKLVGPTRIDQLKIFKKRNQNILNNHVPPLGFYDATTSQENCVLKQQPKVIFNKQERFAKDKREDDNEEGFSRNSPKRPASILKKHTNEIQQNQSSNGQPKSVQIEGSTQKFKNVSDSSVAKIDQVNPKIFEQIREQEERRFRIEKNIDQIALDFNSEKASTLFTQNVLQTKQKMRRIRNNLNNMEYDTMTFFEQLIQKQQKVTLDEGLS